MNINFEGKRILVTGAGQGIGRDIVKHLYKGGATVIAISRTLKYLETLKSECPTIEIISVDLQSWTKTREALKNIGKIDGLVNNAAIAVLESFFDIKEESVDLLLDVNIKAVINISQFVAKIMVDNKIKGSIVNISSQTSQAGIKDHVVYTATKGAMDAMTRAMVIELGQYGIRLNCVNPTVVLTDMGKLGWSKPEKANQMLSKIPLNKFAEVEDVVYAVIFLLSDKASMINGVTLPIDGGFLAI